MKLILDDGSGVCAQVTMPVLKVMQALTRGGFGGVVEVAPAADVDPVGQEIVVTLDASIDRMVDRMVVDGYNADFAVRWFSALRSGGETDATALDLVRGMAYRNKHDQVAADHSVLPASRLFRDAWRVTGNVITVDLAACRAIFARKLIEAKLDGLKGLEAGIEQAVLLGEPDAAREASFAALKALDLRAIGSQIAAAGSAEELLALWPSSVKPPEDIERAIVNRIV